MTEEFSIEIEGLEELLKRFGDSSLVNKVLRQAMDKSLFHLQEKLAIYPTPPSGRKATFVSPRQRRWFFWALRTGQIVVPYRRTGTLGRSWTTKVEGQGAEMTGRVGTAIPYARYVMGAKQQHPIHQGRWHTVEGVARDARPKVIGYFNEATQEIARRLAHG